MDAHQLGHAEQSRNFYPTASYSTYNHATVHNIGIDGLELAQ